MHRLAPCVPIPLLSSQRRSSVTRCSDLGMTTLTDARVVHEVSAKTQITPTLQMAPDGSQWLPMAPART